MLTLCTYEIGDIIFIQFIFIFVLLYFSNFLLCSIKILQVNSSSIFANPSEKALLQIVFTFQPNMVMDSGIHASILSHCHHQINFAEFVLKVFYSHPYERTVWHFSHVKSFFVKIISIKRLCLEKTAGSIFLLLIIYKTI